MKYLILITALVTLYACGKPEAAPPAKEKELILLVAPWCEPCKKELEYIKANPPKIKIRIVCETGDKMFDPPSVASCEKMGGLPDEKAWGLYKKHIGTVKTIPASVVLADGVVARTFIAPYQIEDIVAYAEGL